MGSIRWWRGCRKDGFTVHTRVKVNLRRYKTEKTRQSKKTAESDLGERNNGKKPPKSLGKDYVGRGLEKGGKGTRLGSGVDRI